MKKAAKFRLGEIQTQTETEKGAEKPASLGFKFKGRDSNDVVVRGSLPFETLEETEASLKRAGIVLDTVTPASASISDILFWWKNNRVPGDMEMAQLAEKLGELLSVLPSPGQVTQMLARNSSNKLVKAALENTSERLFQGEDLDQALAAQKTDKGRDFFPLTFVYAVRIGQHIGATPDPETNKSVNATWLMLHFFAEAMKKKHALKRKISSAMLYPAVVLLFCFAGFLTEVYVIMPMMAPLFLSLLQGKDDSLPFSTQLMLDIGTLFWSVPGIIVLLGTVAAFGSAFYWLFFTPKGIVFWERISLNLPRAGAFYRDYNASQISRTLAIVWEGEDDMKKRFEIARDTAENVVYREMLAHILNHLSTHSVDLAEVIPPYYDLMGEEFASTVDTVMTTGMGQKQFYAYAKVIEQRAEENLDNTIAFLQNFAIVIPSAFVIFILIASYSPLFQLIGKLANHNK